MTTVRQGRSGLLALAGLCVAVVAAGAIWMRGGASEPHVVAAPSKPRPEKLEVYYGGCHEVHVGPVCLIAETSTITLWMEDPGFVPTVRVDGAVVPARVAEVDGGVQLKVRVAPGVGVISVGEGEVGQAWELRLRRRPPATVLESIKEMRNRDPKSALAIATATPSTSNHERAEIRSVIARLEWDLGRTRWIETAESSASLHEANGCITGASNDRAFMSFRLRNDGELRRARAALAALEQFARLDPELEVSRHYFLAAIEQQSGDARAALEHLRLMERWGKRLSDETYRVPGIQMKLLLLSFLARKKDARELLAELSDEIDRAPAECERARMLNNLAWFGRNIDLDSSMTAAEKGTMLYNGACQDSLSDAAIMNLTTARIYLLAGRVEAASEIVLRLRSPRWTTIPKSSRRALDELQAQVLLAQDRPSAALKFFESVLTNSTHQADSSEDWLALLGAARCQVALGNETAAIDGLESAEAVLDHLVLSVPLGEGRSLFAEDHIASTSLLLELLVQVGRERDAHRVATRSIRRHSSLLAISARVSALPDSARSEWEVGVRAYREARDRLSTQIEGDWQLPRAVSDSHRNRRRAAETDLAREMEKLMTLVDVDWDIEEESLPDRTGQLILHPTQHGLLLLLRDAGGIISDVVPTLDSSWRLRTWLGSVDAVRVLAFGQLNDIPVHDIVRRMSPNMHVVTYSSGLPPVSPSSQYTNALVISDPDGTLPRSRGESETVRKYLESKGWNVELLSGDRATRETLLALLTEGDFGLLHFAGHSDSMAPDGWRSYLRLAGGERLEVVDVFSLARAPNIVILSSCRGSGDGLAPIGIAQAFLARGASTVLAATEAVGDSAASSVMDSIYGHLGASSPSTLLARAQWASAESDVPDLSKFRAYVR